MRNCLGVLLLWLPDKWIATHKASYLNEGNDYLNSRNCFGALSKNNIGHFICGPKTYMNLLISEKTSIIIKEFLFPSLRISNSFKGAEFSD